MQCRIWFNKKAENDKQRVLGPCVTYGHHISYIWHWCGGSDLHLSLPPSYLIGKQEKNTLSVILSMRSELLINASKHNIAETEKLIGGKIIFTTYDKKIVKPKQSKSTASTQPPSIPPSTSNETQKFWSKSQQHSSTSYTHNNIICITQTHCAETSTSCTRLAQFVQN